MALKRIKLGDEDFVGREALEIFSTGLNHQIYRTFEGLKFTYSSELVDNVNKISTLISRVTALQTGLLRHNQSINQELATAIDQGMNGDIAESKKLLVKLERRLQNIRTIKGRLSYLLACVLSVFGFLILLTFVLITNTIYPEGVLGRNAFLFRIAACGALGGFLSVSLGIRKVEIDMDEDWTVSAISGATRIIVAVISSLFVYFAISSGIIFAKLAELGNEGYYAFSVLAGFSESFVPNMLKRVAKEES